MNELKLENYRDELVSNPSANINEFIAKNLIEIVFDQLNHIYEYDTQIVEKETIYKIVDEHYLLLNKIYMKDFYPFWQSQFVASSNIDGLIDLKTFCILMVNPNFASAWSRRKSILVARLNQVISYDQIMILLNHRLLTVLLLK